MTVELSKSRDNLHELAKELGIRAELIYRWHTELLAKPEGSGAAPASQAMVNRNRLPKKPRLLA